MNDAVQTTELTDSDIVCAVSKRNDPTKSGCTSSAEFVCEAAVDETDHDQGLPLQSRQIGYQRIWSTLAVSAKPAQYLTLQVPTTDSDSPASFGKRAASSGNWFLSLSFLSTEDPRRGPILRTYP